MVRVALLFSFALSFCSVASADSISDTEIMLTGLSVWRAETDNRFGSFLLLSRKDAKVMVSCKDGGGELQSSILLTFKNDQGAYEKRLFAGRDFYCYGALALAKEVAHGVKYDLILSLEKEPDGVRRVRKAVLRSEDGSRVIESEVSSARWLER